MRWVKLYVEILDDHKMATLSDNLFRVCVNLFALAGRIDDAGRLGTTEEVAYALRLELETAAADLEELKKVRVTTEKKGVWSLKNFDKRNERPPSSQREAVKERVKKHRETKPIQEEVKRESNDHVTPLHSIGNDPRIDKNRVEEIKEEKPTGANPAPETPKDDPVINLAATFERAAGIKRPMPTSPKAKTQVGVLWWNPLREMIQMGNGSAPETVKLAVEQMRRDHLTIAAPNSILKVFTSLNGERVGAEPKPFELSPEQIELRDQMREFKKHNANPV